MKGIRIAKNKGVEDKDLQYDSSKPRLQIAMGRNPPHLNLVDVKGTALVTNGGNGFYAEEILFTTYHGLGYKPIVLVYFYVYSNNSYGIGKFFYGFGASDDYLTFEVDKYNLYIKHIFDDTGFQTGLTSTAPSFGNIRVKYMIFSNPVAALTNG